MIPYLVVLGAAGVVTAAVTPLVARFARRVGAFDAAGDPRKVHARDVPTMGGIALLVGFAAALGAAWLLAAFGWDVVAGADEGQFEPIFRVTSEPLGLLAGAVVIVLVGVVDDTVGLSAPVKLAGQILGALPPVLLGIQIVFVWVPGLGVLSLSPDLGVPLTVLAVVVMVNAVNFIDGLDGLAAGVAAIAATAFFAYAYRLDTSGIVEAVPSSATLAAVAIAGIALGFLVHNFHPAKIFMGDTGAMLLGLLLAVSGVAFIGRTTDPGYVDLFGVFPLVIPVLVLAVPFADTAFAVTRRLYRKRPIASPDRGHLHHRLLHLGVGHRGAVLTLYYWSAVAAFAVVAPLYLRPLAVVAVAGGLALLGAVFTAAGLRRARRTRAAAGEPDARDGDPHRRRRARTGS